MNTISGSSSNALHTLTNRIQAKVARGVLAVALGALALGASPKASAQQMIIKDPGSSPDLTVSVAAPATAYAYTTAYLTFTVSNLAPTTGIWRLGASNNVWAHVDLTGLVPVYVQNAGGLTCSFSKQTTGGEWSTVDCTGTMAWGSSATIYVYFQPAQSFYCGRPLYTDASVSYTAGGAERSSANNRAIARTDQIGCIN